MERYYIQPNGDKWSIVRQTTTGNDNWTNNETVGTYSTFEAAIAQADTYSPLAYDDNESNIPAAYDGVIDV